MILKLTKTQENTMYPKNKKKEDEHLVQWKTTCSLIKGQDGKEFVRFIIPHGKLGVICEANLPPDNQDQDDVSVKVYLNDKDFDEKYVTYEEVIVARLMHEFTTYCKVMTTSKNKEALVFTLYLGFLKVICIANIPESDKPDISDYDIVAPVYVKYKFYDEPFHKVSSPRYTSESIAP